MDNEITLSPDWGVTQADVDESRNWEGMNLAAPRLPGGVRGAWQNAPASVMQVLRDDGGWGPTDISRGLRRANAYRFRPGVRVATPAAPAAGYAEYPVFTEAEPRARPLPFYMVGLGAAGVSLVCVHGYVGFLGVTYRREDGSDEYRDGCFDPVAGVPVSVRFANPGRKS